MTAPDEPDGNAGLEVLRVTRVVADLERSEAFYRDGLGFHRVGGGVCDPNMAAILGVAGATITQSIMRLGQEEIALARFDPPGASYPADSRANDLWFQHLAIVVDDMETAYRTLARRSPPAISIGGPQTLPPANGAVVAFKFRDPDGHPLELIHFPPGQGRDVWRRRAGAGFLGIDHSALSVAATARSAAFYRRLGFSVTDRSLNHGPAQSRLDGLPDARVRVTGLRPPTENGPGLELLAYRPCGRAAPAQAANSRATDWISVLVPRRKRGDAGGPGARATVRRDPDGHILMLIEPP